MLGLRLGIGLNPLKHPASPADLVASWVSRAVVNGGTVSPATEAAVLAFLVAARNGGFLPRIKRLNLFAGGNLAACLTPQIISGGAAVDINTNFVEGDYTENLGLRSGSTRWLNTGFSFLPGTMIGGYTMDCRSAITATGIQFIGATEGTRHARFNKTGVGSVQESQWGTDNAAAVPSLSVTFTGLWRSTRKSSTVNQITRNGSGNTATGENTLALPNIPIYVFARNLNGSPGGIVSASARWSGYAIDDGTISDADEAAWRSAWTTFRSAMGR